MSYELYNLKTDFGFEEFIQVIGIVNELSFYNIL